MNVKKAARTVIVDEQGRFAILEVRDSEYYKIPGGGIEEGEDERAAAIREALEESGCTVELLDELEPHSFTETHPEFGVTKHTSVCFVARLVSRGDTAFDAWEQSRNFKLHWWDYDTALTHFLGATPQSFFGKEINRRDMNYLIEAKAVLDRNR